MPKPYDDSLKILISENPQDFASWLVKGARGNGQEILRFHFQSIELAKLSPEELRQTGLAGLLPLMILTKGGATHEVAEEIMKGLQVAG